EYLKYKPNDDFVYYSLGQAYLRAGDVLKATEAYKNAINFNNNKALYYKELAIAYNYLDKDDDVVRCLTKAKQLGQSDGIVHTFLGKFFIKQLKIEEAIEVLEKAIKENPNNLLAKIYLALALIKKNDIEPAINYLHEIVRAPIKTPLKMEADTLLKKLS
ncbi:tetratricopeptide repeat protein, partial [candidate division KSB1 bacterium]|nr:tetratricopeptide repeat protein [candidate division KSB1 bacterium]